MIEGVEIVTNIISRYGIFERVYFKEPTAASSRLREAVVVLYSSILAFLGKTYRYFGQNTVKRWAKTLFHSPMSDIEDALAKVEKKELEVDRTAQLISMEILQRTSLKAKSLNTETDNIIAQMGLLSSQLGMIELGEPTTNVTASIQEAVSSAMAPTQRVYQTLNHFRDFMEQELRQEVLDWLSTVRYDTHHSIERKDRLDRSGQWMFESSEFRRWNDSAKSCTLWLHGMSGCGKTKLA